MKIDAELKATVKHIKPFYDAGTKAHIVTPTITFKVTKKEAKGLFGQDFWHRVFDGVEEVETPVAAADNGAKKGEPDTETKFVFGWRSPLKLAAVFEQHSVKMLGADYVVTPEQLTVHAVEDEAEPAVMVDLKLPMKGDNVDFCGKLLAGFGESVKVKLAWMQRQIPGTEGEEVRKAGPRNFGNNAPKTV